MHTYIIKQMEEGQLQRIFAIARNVVFTFVTLNYSYQLGHSIYQRGLGTFLWDCQRWIKMVSSRIAATYFFCTSSVIEIVSSGEKDHSGCR